MMPSAEVNSVIIRPQPPRLRMKRRKTVSVMPAMGASTVAGRISTAPSVTDAGTRTPAGAMRWAGLSKNLVIRKPWNSDSNFYVRTNLLVVDQVLLDLAKDFRIDAKAFRGNRRKFRYGRSFSSAEYPN